MTIGWTVRGGSFSGGRAANCKRAGRVRAQLVELGADTQQKNNWNQTPMRAAAVSGSLEAMLRLATFGRCDLPLLSALHHREPVLSALCARWRFYRGGLPVSLQRDPSVQRACVLSRARLCTQSGSTCAATIWVCIPIVAKSHHPIRPPLAFVSSGCGLSADLYA